MLTRAIFAAFPAGLLIWLTANIRIDQTTLLTLLSSFLDPFARLLGLDSTILLAFILGIPANEIVIPVMIMAYTAQSSTCGFSKPFQPSYSAHGTGLDLFHSCVHADFFCPALALRYHTFNHKKRNPQPEMDSACLFAAHLHGVSALFSCHLFFSDTFPFLGGLFTRQIPTQTKTRAAASCQPFVWLSSRRISVDNRNCEKNR